MDHSPLTMASTRSSSKHFDVATGGSRLTRSSSRLVPDQFSSLPIQVASSLVHESSTEPPDVSTSVAPWVGPFSQGGLFGRQAAGFRG